MPSPKIIRNSARCRKCGVEVESRHRHDFVWCRCQSIAVDGGHDYMKRTGNMEDIEETSVCDPPMPAQPTDPAPASAPEPVKCPKCGAPYTGRAPGNMDSFECESLMVPGGTYVEQTHCCLSREAGQLRAAVARLEGELATRKVFLHIALADGAVSTECEIVEEENGSLLVRSEVVQTFVSALAGSVPKAVALRACRVSAMGGACAPLDGEDAAAMIERVCAHESELEEWDVSWWGEVVESALARALTEHEADRAASATQGDPSRRGRSGTVTKIKLSKTQAAVLDIICRLPPRDRSDIAVALDPSKSKLYRSIVGNEFREPGGRALRLTLDAIDALSDLGLVRRDKEGRYHLTAAGKKAAHPGGGEGKGDGNY